MHTTETGHEFDSANVKLHETNETLINGGVKTVKYHLILSP
jgi:hypothetical protein